MGPSFLHGRVFFFRGGSGGGSPPGGSVPEAPLASCFEMAGDHLTATCKFKCTRGEWFGTESSENMRYYTRSRWRVILIMVGIVVT